MQMSEISTILAQPGIPIRFCPQCQNRPLVVMDVLQGMRVRDGMEIKFACTKCGTTERVVLKPPVED
jgi:RNase P subunit RPR2